MDSISSASGDTGNALVDPDVLLDAPHVVIDTKEVLRLASLLDSVKRVSSLARTLAKDVVSDVPVHRVVVAALTTEPRLRPTSTYGNDDAELLDWAAKVLTEDESTNLGVRSGLMVVRPERDDVKGHARFLFPIRSEHELTGVVLCEAGPARRQADLSSVAAPFIVVSRLLSMVTRSTWDSIGAVRVSDALHSTGGDRRQGLRRDNGSEQAALSERQLRILRLMAEGLTNAQIADRIAFSESTVRLETLAIFRFFDVHSRQDASEAARMRGMLPPP